MSSVQENVTLHLDIYGVTVSIHSLDQKLVDHLGEDFAHFQVGSLPSAARLMLFLHAQRPPYEDVPPMQATVYTPRNVSFHHEGNTYIDYSGRALAVLHTASSRLDVFSEDLDLLYEVGFLFLLSQVGEQLDERHLHRIHALGISVSGKAGLVLLPMGGGKSTLATHLLSGNRSGGGIDFLSDDSPLVDRDGTLHAFPLRIGILPGSEAGYEARQLRTIQRMEFGPKLVLLHASFAHRIVPSAPPAFLFLGRRSLSPHCKIVPASNFAALRALIPNCVIGLGLFQGMEFVFNRDVSEVFRKLRIAFSRLRNCMALVRRSSVHTIVLGRDLEENAEAILHFMRSGEHPKH